MSQSENIHPEFARMLGRSEKEKLLRQRGLVVWMYGLSGSGKSTLANALERRLHWERTFTQILDGDNIRSGLNSNLGFTDEDRTENIRRIAEVSKLFLQAGVVTITAFICPRRELREMAREIVGAADFVEVYVKASYEECERRDVKGLYAKAAEGGVSHFTGKDSAFEEPEEGKPDFTLDTETRKLDDCVSDLYTALVRRVRQ